MSFAQINYTQVLGTGPTAGTIANVGCFLTAFCNLLERMGETVDPPTLNNYFIAHGNYLMDGPDKDNLGWGSISAYDGNIVVTGIGGANWPPSNNAIVKFIYRSQRTGNEVTHFCLVVDAANRIILDSWDGREKESPYGDPVAYAMYEKHGTQIVEPPAPIETPAFTVDTVEAKTVQLNKDVNMWDLNQRTWPGIVNSPVGAGHAGDLFHTSRMAHHIIGESYYIPDGEDSHGYNVKDCNDYVEPVTSTPPAAPLKPSGNPDNTYDVIKPLPGFMTGTNAGNHVDQVNTVSPGNYFIYNTHPKNSDLINVTSILGTSGSWINKSDNVPDAPSPPTQDPVPAILTPVEPVVLAAEVTAPSWKDTYVPFPKPVHYISARQQIVYDINLQEPDMPLPKYSKLDGNEIGVVSAYGVVTKDGVDYYRLKTNNDPDFNFWYSVPKLDPVTRTPNLLVMPTTPTVPVGKATVARDTIHLARSKIETDAINFLDDLVPKFFKRKK